MKRKTTRILFVIVILMALLLAAIGDAALIAPKRYVTRYETLSSSLIGEQMNDVRILFFSDLKYGTFMNEERLSDLIDHINNCAPDAVVFGGDLMDEAVSMDDASRAVLEKYFSAIDAPLGKFAVYGDQDDKSEETKAAADEIYNASGFEVLNNRSIAIHNGGYQSITLVGLDNKLNGTPDVTSAYSAVARNTYVITVCHTPDSADDVPADLTSYFLAGHSLGGQVYYFFSALYTPAAAEKHLRGKSTISDSFTLDITNGVGTTDKDIRFLADAEVVVYTLKHA